MLLLGASGAVGSQVLALAVTDDRVAKIMAPSRRPLKTSLKLINPVIDFSQSDWDADWLAVDSVVCALGSTIKEAGSQAAFARVDRDLPVLFAKLAHHHGAKSFALNSSLGASLNGNFYLKTKAEAEEEIAAIGYDSYTIVRPSLIDAAREKRRNGESLGLAVARVFRPLIPAHYRPVTANQIARALLDAALLAEPGRHVLESETL